MTQTTIKVPRALRDRLKARAAAHGLTLAQEVERLLDEPTERPGPTVGGFTSGAPLSADEIDDDLASGFGSRETAVLDTSAIIDESHAEHRDRRRIRYGPGRQTRHDGHHHP